VAEVSKRVEDMNYFELLAWLGIGSSHPGGFPATKQNLQLIQVKPEEYVLDAGCGTGLTACYLAKTVGCKVVGVDINPEMIAKARLRAEREGVADRVQFQIADVYKLPFKRNTFNLVLGESITVFLDKPKVYQEFFRVLKPGGRVADLEMALLQNLPPPLRQEMALCYGKNTDPLSFAEWKKALAAAGFQEVEIINPQPLHSNFSLLIAELRNDWMLIKDLVQKASSQPALLPRLQRAANFARRCQGYFAYGLIYGRKPLSATSSFKDSLVRFLLPQ